MEQLSLAADELVATSWGVGNIADSISELAISALGGYARRQLFPNSDFDLLIIHRGALSPTQEQFIRTFTAGLWDSGVRPSIQFADLQEISVSIKDDVILRTAYIDNLFIAGNRAFFDEFQQIINAQIVVKGKFNFTIAKIYETRRQGNNATDSIYLLEPNVKEGRGGLRSINVIWWLSRVHYGTAKLSDISYEGFATACEFIFKTRAHLHLLGKRKNDILKREQQEALAEKLGFIDDNVGRAVENFMREYYMHAHRLYEISNEVIRAIESRIIVKSASANERSHTMRKLAGGLFSYDGYLIVKSGDLDKPEMLLRLIKSSYERNIPIYQPLIERLKGQRLILSDTDKLAYGQQFGELLGMFPNSGKIARMLLEFGLITAFIPEFAAIRYRIQYNSYHQYTIDEHTLVALETIDGIANVSNPLCAMFSDTLRALARKDLLGLAVLLHDVGKTGEEHTERGYRLALKLLPQLGYDELETRTVANVIRQHIQMSFFAQRRDINVRDEVLRFKSLLNTPLELDLLYILTYADINALGTGKATGWVADRLQSLYARCKEIFAYQDDEEAFREVARAKRGHLQVASDIDDETLYMLPLDILNRYARMTQEFMDTPRIELVALPTLQCWRLFVCANDREGLLRRIAGALSCNNCSILSADIYTPKSGIVIDMVDFTASEFDLDAGNSDWQQKIRTDVMSALTSVEYAPKFARGGVFKAKAIAAYNRKVGVKTEIKIDNVLTRRGTMVDVFAADRVGALYDILCVFEHFSIGVKTAKISTSAYTLIDSFLVADKAGGRLTNALSASLEAELLRKLN